MKRWQLSLTLAVVLVISALIFLPAYAVSDAFLINTGYTTAAYELYECKNGGYFMVYGFTGATDDNDATDPNHDFVGFIAYDGNGVPLFATTDHIGVGEVRDTGSNGVTWPMGLYRGGINDITARPITVKMVDISFGTATTSGQSQQAVYDLIQNSEAPVLASSTFDTLYDGPPQFLYPPPFCSDIPYIEPGPDEDTGSVSSAGIVKPSRPVIPGCPGDGSLGICVSSPKNNGEPNGIDVWAVNEQGRGYEAFYVPNEVLDQLPDQPESNIEIASNDEAKITLYKLTTGEYQINIGPDEEGKVQVIIFTGVPPTNVYRRDFNIYDVGE